MSSWGLYWVTVEHSPDENWFVVAKNARSAAAYEEAASGFESGGARAQRLAVIPIELEQREIERHKAKLKKLGQLNKLGYSARTMFPGLQTVCAEIAEIKL